MAVEIVRLDVKRKYRMIDQIATQPGPHVVGVDIFTAIANFFYILFYDTVDKVLQLFVIKFLMTPNISQFISVRRKILRDGFIS